MKKNGRGKGKKGPYKLNDKFLQVAEEWIIQHGLQEFGGALLKDYIKEMGIDYVTHYNWMREQKVYNSMVERAKELYRKVHTKKLFNTLMEAAEGGYRENTTEDTEYKPNPNNPEKPMIAKKRTHKDKKFYQPNVAAAIFLMTNLDPESFINRQRSDVVVKESVAPQLSQEEARDLLKRLEEEF